MLYNLDFLTPGQPWPPSDERARLERYAINKKLFDGEHGEVYKKQLERIQRIIGNYQDIVSYVVVLNYHRLMSLKTADLLLGEPPQILISQAHSGHTDSKGERWDINAWLDSLGLQGVLYQAVVDISRYGVAILLPYREASGRVHLTLAQPAAWYPVIGQDNVKAAQQHVIAQVVGAELRAQIHYPGYRIDRLYALSGNKHGHCLGPMLHESRHETLLTGFAVMPLQGVLTSDSPYGHDDYHSSIDSLVSDIMIRVGQIDRILDKHAMPSMRGPARSIEFDEETGTAAVHPGNYFIYENGDPTPDYMTWQAQLDAAFKQLEILKKELYILSEMGCALLGDEDTQKGGTASARALRLRMINPLSKVARIAANIRQPLKEAIAAAVSLDKNIGLPLCAADIQINWFDGLPNDEKEDTEIIQAQNGGKPTLSHVRSIAEMNDWDEVKAKAEYAEILAETAAALPLIEVRAAPDIDGDVL